MAVRLLAGRWANSLTAATKNQDTLMKRPQDVGLRWNIYYFGLQRLELLVKARNKFDRYERYDTHLGQRMGVYSSWAYRPISGFCTAVEDAGANRILYVVKGPAPVRMKTELDTTVYASTDDIQTTIQTILTDHVEVDNGDFSNIGANTTTLGGWQTKQPQGSYPLDAIQELLKKSDSNGTVYDFYLKDESFDGTSLQKWIPYYTARSSTAAVDWKIHLRDIVPGSIRRSRSIDNIKTNVTVYYGTVTFTANGGSTTTATKASGSFITDGVKPGDRFTNLTNSERAKITSVAALTITHDGTATATANTDSCAIELQEPKSSQNDTTTEDYWTAEHATFEPEMDSTQATQYAALLKSTDPEQITGFTIGAPWIRDGNRARWPLWEVIAQGGGYIQIVDLYPAASLFSTSRDAKTTFFITSMDYTYKDNKLRITVDNPDTRLDARLRRAGILGSEMVGV